VAGNGRPREEDRRRLGAAIRAVRTSGGRRLADVAAEAGVSIGLLSQVERGLHDPSLESLRSIAEALGTTPFRLLAETRPTTGIVRRGEGRRLELPDTEVEYELLSPSMGGPFEIVRWELEPGGSGGSRLRGHAGQEATLLLSGRILIETEGARYELEAGDCITLDARVPHRFTALGEMAAVGVSIMSPPAF
jgi:transcriptional regulator with XRE-family HTH domain